MAVLIPVLNRPARVGPLVESITSAQSLAWTNPVFICSPNDQAEIAAVRDAGLEPLIAGWHPGRGDYARKMNLAFVETVEPYVFLGADDLNFNLGWADVAIATQMRSGACVVGTNDLGNARTMNGTHSTHTLVHRGYGECGTVDDPGVLLHDGYWHNFVDDEFVQTAVARRTYAHAATAVVEHLHPDWKKGGVDETYRLGKQHFEDDRVYYRQRQRLWTRGRV